MKFMQQNSVSGIQKKHCLRNIEYLETLEKRRKKLLNLPSFIHFKNFLYNPIYVEPKSNILIKKILELFYNVDDW